MAVDNIGTTFSVGSVCLMGGIVREIDGDTLVVVTADGKHAFRVKSTDARAVTNVPDPTVLDDAIANAVSGKVDTGDLAAYVQKAAGAFTTAPPTSAVAATANNELVRKGEMDTAIAGAAVPDGDKGDVVVSSSGSVWTIDADAVTYAKIQDVTATDRILGRSTAGAGIVEEIVCTAAGRAILDDVDAAAQRTTLGAQPLDTFLTSIAALGTQADRILYTTAVDTAAETRCTEAARTFLAAADVSEQQAVLGLVPGTDVQTQDAELQAIAGLTSAADRLPYFTGSGTAALATFTTAGRALVDDADASAQRTTLGLGTIATQSTRSMAVQITANASGLAWTNMPAAHTILYGNISSVRQVDLTSYTQCRLTCVQFGAAASGAKLRLRYGSAGSSGADTYSAIAASELELSLGTGAGGQYLATAWTDLVAGAKADKFIAVTGIDGDGAADPSFFSIVAEFR